MTITAFALTGAISWGDRVSTACSVTLLGMGAIFLILTLLWLSIEIMHLIVHGRKKKPQKAEQTVAPSQSTPVPTERSDDGAVVAAIIAAITAMRAEEGNSAPSAFRVVSFKRSARK